MSITCKYEALDAATRDYLQAVRSRKGRRTPGVYVSVSDPLPWWGLVLGPFVGGVMFLGSFASGKDAWAVAMLQTAGVLIAGWPVWFALRRWSSASGKWYGGRYKFFDPLHVYDVQGEDVIVTDLRAVRGVGAVGPGVRFDLGERAVTVPVRSAKAAAGVEEYYAAMAELEGRPDGKWANADAASLGAAAKYFADTHEEPRELSDTGLEVGEVPAAPAAAGRAGWGLGGLLLVALVGAGLFFAFWAVNVPLGDDLAFDRAKEGGAPGLRGYLLDPRSSEGHKQEAREHLGRLYDTPVNHLKGLPPGQKPELRDGLIKLLDTLRASPSPVVSIRVVDESADGAGSPATQLRSDLADGLARSIGAELIAFVAPPDDKPAHLTVRYKLPPAKEKEDDRIPVVAAVTIEVRPTIDSPPTAASWLVPLKTNPGMAGVQRYDLLKQELSRELVGEWKPTPVDLGSGEF